MIKKYTVPFLFLFSMYLSSFAQTIQTGQYPQNFFRYPLDLSPATAGSFGELRPNHFHSGLDFRTNGRTGFPVHAAYDGYVSRLRVQFGGFGNAVYITHPNGYTTVYGHLERFSPLLDQLVRAQQYLQQSFEVDFNLAPTQVMLCKDDVFAWSGNAGASAGPHLHFEIRDTQTEQTINAQLFGLVIPDKVPPTLGSICIYHLNGAPFSEKTFRQFLPVSGAAGKYHLAKPQTLELSGQIGFGITANDMTSASFNHNGIYSIELKLDGTTVYTFAAERFAFDQTHAINAYIDYPTFLTSRRWMQKCFILPGSKISLYPQSINRGVITFSDNNMHELEYVVKDVAGNTSTLTLKVKSSIMKDRPIYRAAGTLFRYDKQNEFSNDKIKVTVPTGNLYDDLDFTYTTLPQKPGTYSVVHRIHNKFTPLNDSYQLWIKPDVSLGAHADKAVIVNTDGICENSIYEDGYVKCDAHTFGDYYIKIDTVPPVIHSLTLQNGGSLSGVHKINFKMSDNLSGIKTYAGRIDGKWVLMEWDYKTRVLSYTFDNSVAAGKHIFELTVTDNKNNSTTFSANFLR